MKIVYEIVDYDAWADGNCGWTVNGIQHTGRYVVINGNANTDEILKALVAEGILKPAFASHLDVYLSNDGHIEVSDYENDDCPLFFLEQFKIA